MSTTKVQGDMIDVDAATVAVVAVGDKFNFLDITDSLVKEDTVQGIVDLVSAGAWAFIESATASTSSTITFSHTVASGYDYKVMCRDVKNSQDNAAGAELLVQLATTGPSWVTASYSNAGMKGDSTAIASARDGITDGISFFADMTVGGTGAGETWSGEMILLNPGASDETDGWAWFGGDNNSAALNFGMNFGRCPTGVHTDIRVAPGGGTFSTGEFALFRRVLS